MQHPAPERTDTVVTLTATPEDQRIAWLTAVAITIHIAESALPSPLPGIKPGLANIITVTVLVHFGWRAAAWVALLRVLAGSLLIGTFLTPTFVLSLGGSLASVAILWFATRLPGRGFSALGYSVLAALAHMGAQFLLAWTLFIPHPGLVHLLPILLTAAVLFGVVNGIIAARLLATLATASTRITDG